MDCETLVKPRLLLVEDDPVSAMFLRAATEAFPAEVDVVSDAESAVRIAREHHYDAWLIDSNLPDANGGDLLARLRSDESVCNPNCPALAHTADAPPVVVLCLESAGFGSVVRKPLSIDAWHGAISKLLNREHGGVQVSSLPAHPTPWDDEAALRVMGGRAAHVTAMRNLFCVELPAQHEFILGALGRGEYEAAHGMLHRLKASCGFVGAKLLADAVENLSQRPYSQSVRDAFSAAVDELLAFPVS